MLTEALLVGKDTEGFTAFQAAKTTHAKNFPFLTFEGISGNIILRSKPQNGLYRGIPDDNRTAIFPEHKVSIDGRIYVLAIKGVGARTHMYGNSPLDFTFKQDFGRVKPREKVEGLFTTPRLITSECWYGEAPWGAQGEAGARYALRFSEEITQGCSINGFYVCPVLEINEFSPELLRKLGVEQTYWYRRYGGTYFQEQRLVPSNVRLFYQSEAALGTSLSRVLELCGVTTLDELDSFIDNYIRSGIAALTLFARTLHPCRWGLEGLDYGDVWLDKDSVIAPDGTVHFVDLEGLEWFVAGQDWTLEERVQFQFGRNFYEFMYILDLLLRDRLNMVENSTQTPSQQILREEAATRIELALLKDPFVKCEWGNSGLDLVVLPKIGAEAIPIRVIDLT